MSHSIQEYCGDMVYLGPITPTIRFTLGKILNKASQTLLRRRFAYLHSVLLAKGYAKVVRARLDRDPVDLIFVPSASTVAAFLETSAPMIYLSGATFASMQSYYPQFSQLSIRSIREGNLIEKRSIENADLLLYASQWAAQSAVQNYDADRSKIHVLPYGANLDRDEIPPKSRVLSRVGDKPCRLLFLGVDWQRKGGDIAFETLLELERQGIEAELTVCGCTPPAGLSHKRMIVIPYLNKNDDFQRRKLMNLLMNSDFLLLPTRSECFGVVFCEASAFGLPIITTDTGGVGGAVRNGENGFMLPLEASGHDYANLIAQLSTNDSRYYELVRSSRRAFDERLNWDAWGTTVGELIRGMV